VPSPVITTGIPPAVRKLLRDWTNLYAMRTFHRVIRVVTRLRKAGIPTAEAAAWACRIEIIAFTARQRPFAPRRDTFVLYWDDDIDEDFAQELSDLTFLESVNFELPEGGRRKRGARDAYIFLRTPGGHPGPAYRAMRYLRHAFREVHVAVAHEARSSGTLFALGATRIHMGPTALLGPLDAQVRLDQVLGETITGAERAEVHRSVEEALTGFEEVMRRVRTCGSMEEREFLLDYLDRSDMRVENLGFFLRMRAHMAGMATRMLEPDAAQLPHPPAEIARRLTADYADHGHGVDVAEAKGLLGAKVVVNDAPAAMAELLPHLLAPPLRVMGIHARWISYDVEAGMDCGESADLGDLCHALRATGARVEGVGDEGEE
jgi:hypothetical protein